MNGDDDRAATQEKMEREQITWRSWWNGGQAGPLTAKWRVHMWPWFFIIDHKGVIRFKQVREKTMDEAVYQLVKELEEVRRSGS